MYKIFKALGNENIIETLDKCISEISPKIYLFKYEVSGYEYFLNEMAQYNCKQVIFTSDIFYKILKKVDIQEVRIKEIKISDDLIDEFGEEIESLILELYREKNIFVEKLLNRLKLFEISSGIEIEYIDFSVKEKSRSRKIKIFNSGIISTNLSEESLCILLKEYLRGIKI